MSPIHLSPSHQRLKDEDSLHPDLNVPVIVLSEGNATKKDATTFYYPLELETRVMVDDPESKEKQLVLSVAGKTNSFAPKYLVVNDSFVESECEDLHRYILEALS